MDPRGFITKARGEQFIIRRSNDILGNLKYDNSSFKPDALCVTLNCDAYLEGIGVLCAKDTRAKLIVFKGDNNEEREKCGEILASKEMTFGDVEEKEKEARKMALNNRILLKKRRKYTLELDVYGGDTYESQNARKQSSKKVGISFTNAVFSPNGTDSSSGQFPSLYFSKEQSTKEIDQFQTSRERQRELELRRRKAQLPPSSSHFGSSSGAMGLGSSMYGTNSRSNPMGQGRSGKFRGY